MTTPRAAFLSKIANGLEKRRHEELLRTLELPAGIDFTSNDYLGFCADSRLRDSVAKAIQEFGTGAGASRLLRGNHPVHVETEKALAEFCGREAALLFSSGFAANLGLFGALAGDGDVLFSDSLNHASIIDGMRLSKAERVVYEHQNYQDLESKLQTTPCSGQRFIVTESVFSMDGDISNLPDLIELAEKNDALVIVDEAHSTGLYGNRGSGIVERDGLESSVLCSMHTGGKALGVGGAWIAGDQALISHLVNHARSFIYSTAPIPALAHGIRSAIEHLQAEPSLAHELHSRAEHLRKNLRKLGINTLASDSHIIPVLVGENDQALKLAESMRDAGYDVRAVRPPTVPPGTARLRLTVRATMETEMLDQFAETLKRNMTDL